MAASVERSRSVSSMRSSILPPCRLRVEPVEQRRARAADVQEAGGRGGETGDDRRGHQSSDSLCRAAGGKIGCACSTAAARRKDCVNPAYTRKAVRLDFESETQNPQCPSGAFKTGLNQKTEQPIAVPGCPGSATLVSVVWRGLAEDLAPGGRERCHRRRTRPPMGCRFRPGAPPPDRRPSGHGRGGCLPPRGCRLRPGAGGPGVSRLRHRRLFRSAAGTRSVDARHRRT